MLSPASAEVALADSPDASHGARFAGVVYGGLTSNGWPVMFQVSRDGRRVIRAIGAIETKCSQGGTVIVADPWTRLPISRRGGFRASFRDSGMEGQNRFEESGSIQARVNRARTRITGTWRIRLVVHSPDGSVNDCNSGAVRFTAER
jgi:hypothetical protein